LTYIDVDKNANIRVAASWAPGPGPKFTITLGSWSDTKLWRAEAVWLKYPISTAVQDPAFETGTWNTFNGNAFQQGQSQQNIDFGARFTQPPNVYVWINHLDLSSSNTWSLNLETTQITTSGFTLNVNVWNDTPVYGLGITWFAIPVGSTRISAGILGSGMHGSAPLAKNPGTSGRVDFPKKFRVSEDPKVLLAFSGIDVSNDSNLRLKADCTDVTTDGFKWSFDTWDDTRLYNAGGNYIVFH